MHSIYGYICQMWASHNVARWNDEISGTLNAPLLHWWPLYSSSSAVRYTQHSSVFAFQACLDLDCILVIQLDTNQQNVNNADMVNMLHSCITAADFARYKVKVFCILTCVGLSHFFTKSSFALVKNSLTV